MIFWPVVVVLLSSVQAILTTWLAFENCDLKAENRQLRARLAAHEAPTDYLKGESDVD